MTHLISLITLLFCLGTIPYRLINLSRISILGIEKIYVEGILKAGLKLSTSYDSYRYILAKFEPGSFPIHAKG
jgi:hypothetical protein